MSPTKSGCMSSSCIGPAQTIKWILLIIGKTPEMADAVRKQKSGFPNEDDKLCLHCPRPASIVSRPTAAQLPASGGHGREYRSPLTGGRIRVMPDTSLQYRLATRDDLVALTELMNAAISELQTPFLDAAQIASSRRLWGSTPSSSTTGPISS